MHSGNSAVLYIVVPQIGQVRRKNHTQGAERVEIFSSKGGGVTVISWTVMCVSISEGIEVSLPC